MIAATDRDGASRAYYYNSQNELINVVAPDGGITTLTYSGGLLAGIIEPGNRVSHPSHPRRGPET